jgi:YfiH family protein
MNVIDRASSQTPAMVQADALNHRAIRHGFFGRRGGESGGIYSGNNCGFGSADDPVRVALNRKACAAALGLSQLVTVHQRHTPTVVIVDRPWEHTAAPIADALVTRLPGIGLGILTADCAPVLFADARAGVVGAAHAGWRGAFDGVLQATVDAMVQQGATREHITAVVGPCIGAASYEVGPEFVARFVECAPAFARYFSDTKANGHAQFNLPAFAVDRLKDTGIGAVADVAHDTCAEADAFFSYRRATLRGEPDYGRQLSVIGLA